MKKVNITELKNNLSAYIDAVRHSKQSLLVFDRNTPAVRIVAAEAESPENADETVTMQLERAGLLRRASESPKDFDLNKMLVKPQNKDADIVRALLKEREEGL